MSAAKILWGQVLAVALIILLSIWSATQWTASALGYQPELGEPWFGLFGQPIYRPYDLFWWWFSYDAYAPHVFNKGGMIATSGGFVAIIVAIAMSVWRGRENRNANTYGTARWASCQSRGAQEGCRLALGQVQAIRAYMRRHQPGSAGFGAHLRDQIARRTMLAATRGSRS